MFNPKCSFKIRKKSGVVISKNKRFPCSGIIYIAWTIFLVTWGVIYSWLRMYGPPCVRTAESEMTNFRTDFVVSWV